MKVIDYLELEMKFTRKRDKESKWNENERVKNRFFFFLEENQTKRQTTNGSDMDDDD